MHLWKLFQPLSQIDGGGSGGGSGETPSHFSQDMADLNSSDNEGEDDDSSAEEGDGEAEEEGERDTSRPITEKDDEDEEEDKDEKDEEESDEEETDEDKDEESDEEEVDETRIEGRPTWAQIKKIYPDITKKIPYIREMFFADEKFRQFIADPQQAEEISTKAQNFDRLETSLTAGDPKLLIDELREGNAEAFKKVATNFLPTIRATDANLYTDLTIPILEEGIYHMAEYGKARGEAGKNYVRAAEWMADFFLGKPAIPDLSKRVNGNAAERHPAEVQLEKERAERQAGEIRNASTDINTRIDRSLEAMVREGLDDSLNKFTKDAVVEKTLSEFIGQMKSDRAFQMKLQSLWKTARAANFSEATRKQITEAYQQRGRNVIKAIRARLVQEAGGGRRRSGFRSSTTTQDEGETRRSVRTESRTEEREDRETRKGPKRNFNSQGRSARTGSGRESVLDSSKIDYSKTTDADILSGDPKRIKLKGRS